MLCTLNLYNVIYDLYLNKKLNKIKKFFKKEGNFVTCYNMDECREHYAKCNKPVTEGQILRDSTYMRH